MTGDAAASRQSGRANIVVVLDTSGSMENNRIDAGTTRMQASQKVLKDYLSDPLLGLNTGNGPDKDRVEIAFVNFSDYVKNENYIYSVGGDNKNQYIFTSSSQFDSMIDRLTAAGGTCWDRAMSAAASVLWDDDDPLSVIFISDGDPNSRIYANGNYSNWDEVPTITTAVRSPITQRWES